MSIKIVSFSLWGDNPKYTIGAIRNAELINEVYIGWKARFYLASTVPVEIQERLSEIPNTEIVFMDHEGNWDSMFWRFKACKDADIMISRDTDSRVSLREKYAVDEWLSSPFDFHIMRDHPYHNALIMGGMWGCRNGILNDIDVLLGKFKKSDYWQVDQHFLKKVVYRRIRKNAFVHDEFNRFDRNRRSFPSERVNYEFVGDVYDEFDNRHPEYWKVLLSWGQKKA